MSNWFARTIALALLNALALGCSGGSKGNAASTSDGGASAMIGPSGGEVVLGSMVLDVPAGALGTAVTITASVDPSGPPPGFVASSLVYRFLPEGLNFAVPATVRMATDESLPMASVYWSNPSGSAFEALPTTWVGTAATALVTHFSGGFVGAPSSDAGETASADDAGADDGTVAEGGPTSPSSDAGPADSTAADGAGGADASNPGDASEASTVTTELTGLVEGFLPTGTQSINVSADETDGCTGHEEVTVPAKAFPYIYRFSLSSACNPQTFTAQATALDASGAPLASGTSTCTGQAGSTITCNVSMGLVPSDAGAPSEAAPSEAAPPDTGAPPTSWGAIVVSGSVTGTAPLGASYVMIDVRVEDYQAATPSCTVLTEGYDIRDPIDPTTLPTTYSLTVQSPPEDGNGVCITGMRIFSVSAYGTNADGDPIGTTTTQVAECASEQLATQRDITGCNAVDSN